MSHDGFGGRTKVSDKKIKEEENTLTGIFGLINSWKIDKIGIALRVTRRSQLSRKMGGMGYYSAHGDHEEILHAFEYFHSIASVTATSS
jgi:hypothetical protein